MFYYNSFLKKVQLIFYFSKENKKKPYRPKNIVNMFCKFLTDF